MGRDVAIEGADGRWRWGSSRIPRRRPSKWCVLLGGASVLASAGVIAFPTVTSHAVFIPLLVATGIFQTGRDLARSLVIVLLGYAVAAVSTWRMGGVHPSVFVVIVTVLCILLYVARRHVDTPISLSDGTGLLADLRERLDRQALAPDLTEGFVVDSCVMPAHGHAFSGDFSVCMRRGDVFEIALADVSGHGHGAGMRALLLSGALSGLLGEVDAESFLPAANRYLIRQGWRDGFASCIHVRLDLVSGEFHLGAAGHPSAALFHASTGEWELLTGASGLLLGLFELSAEDYGRTGGRLEPGDALILYSDGVVEGRHGDLGQGTDAMLAQEYQMIAQDPQGAARRICSASFARGGDDDRSVIVLARRAVA